MDVNDLTIKLLPGNRIVTNSNKIVIIYITHEQLARFDSN